MMRCIDHPTMLKDGSGWGAMAGVSAGLLAHRGFTGAPAITVEDREVSQIWSDIGNRWYLMEQDFKRHAVCHWAQPPITGILDILQKNQILPSNIERIQIFTFHEATRLTCRSPKTTEEAQYSLLFPVAAAVIHGNLGPDQLSGAALTDERVLKLADLIELKEDDFCNTQFPKIQMARVRIITKEGQTFESHPTESPWDKSEIKQPHQPPDQELQKKFHWLVSGSLTRSRATDLEDKIWHCDTLADGTTLTNLLISA
jgi:2-methylcitrate dehydratase PrpD